MFKREVPVFWFALLLLMWIGTAAVNYVQSNTHIRRMDAFMAQGDRFTGQAGRELTVRIDQLEERVVLLETNSGR